jgi:catechol 2,3-dioxygenase-like lactoylglutathione lyase family enzyme
MPLLRHLAIRCRDMEKSRRFYEEALGWSFVDYRPDGGGIDMSDGTVNITLIQQPTDWVPSRPEEGAEHIHFGVIVDDLDAWWQRMEDWGAEFSKDNIKQRNPIDPEHHAARSFKVLDPDGNVIDITANKAEWRGVSAVL